MNRSFSENRSKNSCPRCGFEDLKAWQELNEDEKILAEKMPLSAEFNEDERKRHLFCVRCWFEETNPKIENV